MFSLITKFQIRNGKKSEAGNLIPPETFNPFLLCDLICSQVPGVKTWECVDMGTLFFLLHVFYSFTLI